MNGQQPFQGAPAPVELGSISHNSRACTTSLSTLSLIPILTDSKDWTSWNNVVIAAIWTLGAMGHINDKEDTDNPLLQVTYPLELYQDYTQPEQTTHMSFWQLDVAVTSMTR